jgi:excinuclease UvrABC ATPase subunit
LGSHYHARLQGISAAADMVTILNAPLPEQSQQHETKFEEHISSININNLNFTYPNSNEGIKNINLTLPAKGLVAVVGASGSGKSTLVNETIFPILSKELNNARTYPLPFESILGLEYLDKVIEINQKPIGRTPRSNPATYTGVFTIIRDLFTQLPESKIRGYKPGRFSFNVSLRFVVYT